MMKARASGIEISSLTSSSTVRVDWCAKGNIGIIELSLPIHTKWDSFSLDGSNCLDQLSSQMGNLAHVETFHREARVRDTNIW